MSWGHSLPISFPIVFLYKSLSSITPLFPTDGQKLGRPASLANTEIRFLRFSLKSLILCFICIKLKCKSGSWENMKRGQRGLTVQLATDGLPPTPFQDFIYVRGCRAPSTGVAAWTAEIQRFPSFSARAGHLAWFTASTQPPLPAWASARVTVNPVFTFAGINGSLRHE